MFGFGLGFGFGFGLGLGLETNRAYSMRQERGSVVGFKRKPGDEVMVHIRRYKLSGKHLEPIAPHKALASVQAASSLAGVLRALPPDGEQMLDAELEPGDVLQVLELLSCGARLTLTLTRTRTRTRCSSSSAAALA